MPITIFKNHATTPMGMTALIVLCDLAGVFDTVRFVFDLYAVIKVTMSRKTHSEGQKEQTHGLEDAEKFFKDACEIFQREAAKLRQEREAIDDMSKKLDHVHFSSTVKLNVGGHHFTTSLQTLTKDPNSMLAAMFSGKFEMKPAEDGAFFIDRDGTHFRFILNYLRNGELILPDGAAFLKELEAEAKFYQIQGILEELKPKAPKNFEESVILTNEEHRTKLIGWLPQYNKWHLLFRASRDSFKALAFHAKCDNKGPTVTILKSGNNVFGGFTRNSWKSTGKKPALLRSNTKVPFLFCSWGIGYTKRKSNADILMSTPEMDERSRRLLLLDLVH